MTPHEAFAEGLLAEALASQTALHQKKPDDPAIRLFLVELLAFAGRLREARDCLREIASDDPGWSVWRRFFLSLLKAEWRRSVKLRKPVVLPEPVPAHARARWRAIRAMRTGDGERAIGSIDRAEIATPEVRGFVDGREFVGLRDADDRFASVLEAFVHGEYVWFPWESVRRIAIRPAQQQRDRWVREAQVRLRDGSNVAVHLPLVYPGSAEVDGVFAVGLETDHICWDEGPILCIGGKLLLCGEEELPLGEIRMLEISGHG